MEKEVVISSAADLLGGKSHGDKDLRRTMHTNGIITDMMGGLLGRNSATTQLPCSPLVRPWLTRSRYMGIMDNRLAFTGNVVCVTYIQFLLVCVCVCQDNIFCLTITKALPLKGDTENWDVQLWLQTLWGVTKKDCEACIEIWKTPWCHPGGKVFGEASVQHCL